MQTKTALEVFLLVGLMLVYPSISLAQEEQGGEGGGSLASDPDATQPTAAELERISELMESYNLGTITDSEQSELDNSIPDTAVVVIEQESQLDGSQSVNATNNTVSANSGNEDDIISGSSPSVDPNSTKPTEKELQRISELAEKSLAGTATEEELTELYASGATIELLDTRATATSSQHSDSQIDQSLAPDFTEINRLYLMIYGLAVSNTLLLLLLCMYVWRRRHITAVEPGHGTM